LIRQALRKTYTDSDALLLVQCQAALKAGQSTAVPAILANRLSVLHSPALVGYRVANETTAEQAQHTLSTAIAYWRDHQTVSFVTADTQQLSHIFDKY
jgi:hypothetical protein